MHALFRYEEFVGFCFFKGGKNYANLKLGNKLSSHMITYTYDYDLYSFFSIPLYEK
jgi:hypothetical protein